MAPGKFFRADQGGQLCGVFQYISSCTTQSSAKVVGLGRLELPTSPLSGVRSNQLSYRPIDQWTCRAGMVQFLLQITCVGRPGGTGCILFKGGDPAAGSPTATLLRLHPSHHPLLRRLPHKVGSPTSGANDSHGVTGGVYKARERIHRSVLISDY